MRIEEKLGLPPLKEVLGEISENKLRLTRDVAKEISKARGSERELEMALELLKTIKDTPEEQVRSVTRLLREANKLAKQVPLDQLPIREILEKLKEE